MKRFLIKDDASYQEVVDFVMTLGDPELAASSIQDKLLQILIFL